MQPTAVTSPRMMQSGDFEKEGFEMKVLRKIYRALTDVWMVVDADGNAKVYPFLVGYFKDRAWRFKRKAAH